MCICRRSQAGCDGKPPMKLRTLTLSLTGLALTAVSSAQFQIAELGADLPGSDVGIEYFEIRGAANASLAGLTLLAIDGDGGAAGTIDGALDLGSFSTGSSGYFYGRNDLGPAAQAGVNESIFSVPFGTPNTGGGFENGSITFLLVSGFTGATASDLDPENDGVLNETPWTSIVDSFGYTDAEADRSYATVNYNIAQTNEKLTPMASAPGAFMRLPGDGFVFGDVVTNGSNLDFDIVGDQVAFYSAYRGPHYDDTTRDFDFQNYANSGYAAGPDPNRFLVTTLTPGAVNPVPEPATMAAMVLGLGAIAARRRRKSS